MDFSGSRQTTYHTHRSSDLLAVGMVSIGFGLPSIHGATCDKFRVVTHVSGGEGLACKVGDTSTDLVVTHCDEETLFKVEGVTYGECCSTSFEMVR